MSDKKVLVAYYSYSGNTKRIAEKIHAITGGDIFEIKPLREYPKNYNDVVHQAKIEKAENAKPELATYISVAGYDTVYIGTPVWWYTMSSPVKSFLAGNNFAGKTIKPFCTHGGGGASSTFSDMKLLCPDADIKEGFVAFENSAGDKDIEDWLNIIKK